MLFTQARARPSTGTTLDPPRPRAFAPYPHFLASSRRDIPVLQHQPSHQLFTGLDSGTSREHAESRFQLSFSLHATYEAGQRRMMLADEQHASSRPTVLQSSRIIEAYEATQTTLPFNIAPRPDMGLTFLPRSLPGSTKRSRAIADIDGDNSCLQKKKRRLRLFLITSRLSPQFSHPATNIVDRGSSKIAVWAKQKSTGRNLLRKAAILNGIRHRTVAKGRLEGHGRSPKEQQREEEEFNLARLEFHHGSVDTYTRPVTVKNPSVPPAVAVRSGDRFVISGSPTPSPTSSRSPSPTAPSSPIKPESDGTASLYCSPNDAYVYSPSPSLLPRRDYLPLPPSPLGLSNYDAFDADEDFPDPYSHLDDEDEEVSTNLFNNDDDDDQDNVPFSPSAVTSTSSPTSLIQSSQILKTPLKMLHHDFNTMDYSEPVLGDYDQVDDGANTVWPSSFVQVASTATTGSTSPDFHALFATTSPSSKRADSFATSPNFRPTVLNAPASPNFSPTTPATPASPNFPPSTSAPSASQLPTLVAPTPSPNVAATSVSPNFPAIDVPITYRNAFAQRRMSMPHQQRPDDRTRRNSDIDLECMRQRDLMCNRYPS